MVQLTTLSILVTLATCAVASSGSAVARLYAREHSTDSWDSSSSSDSSWDQSSGQQLHDSSSSDQPKEDSWDGKEGSSSSWDDWEDEGHQDNMDSHKSDRTYYKKADGWKEEPYTGSDVDVLQFALTLEHLEDQFYKFGLKRFGPRAFKKAGFHYPEFVRDQFLTIGRDEATHVVVLADVIKSLGSEPVGPCEYDFSSLKRIEDFVAIARALEQTGVSAYTGAAKLIADKGLLTAAATIATVEARHTSFLNLASGGIPISEAFDTALEGPSILALASPFIKKCSFDLGKINNVLVVKNGRINHGDSLDLESKVNEKSISNRDSGLFCSFVHGGTSRTVAGSDCHVPDDIQGFAYVFLTDTSEPLQQSNKKSIISGPALIFVDKDPKYVF